MFTKNIIQNVHTYGKTLVNPYLLLKTGYILVQCDKNETQQLIPFSNLWLTDVWEMKPLLMMSQCFVKILLFLH
jgi:hypothetical protein